MKIQHLKNDGIVQYKCPGCGNVHIINIDRSYPGPCWEWNGSETKPTLTPSVNAFRQYTAKDKPDERCHHFVKEGRIQFLPDCTHDLAGHTVDMLDIED